MAAFLNGILGFVYSMVLLSAGVTPNKWQYWAMIALMVALIVVSHLA